MPVPGVPEIAEGAEKLAAKGVMALEQSSAGRAVLGIWGNNSYELNLTPGGQAAEKLHMEYIRVHDQSLDEGNKALQALRDWHQNNDAARNSVPVKTGTMAQYHAHAVATSNPIQRVTSALANDPDTMHLTQSQLMLHNESKARLDGIAGAYGKNFENLAPILAGMRRSGNADIVQNAQRIADIVSNQVRDTKTVIGKFQGINQEGSAAKTAINKAFLVTNKALSEAGVEDDDLIKPLNTSATYIKPTETERAAHRLIDVSMLPFLAIKHIGQFFNPPQVSPLGSIGKALLQMDAPKMNQTIEASHTLASTLWSAMYRDIQGESGKIAEWTKSPTVGKILARVTHQPGFSWLRRQQLNLGASVGFHSAIDWAHQLVTTGSKISAARLKELQIDPADVIKQGGKLTDEQLAKAVYHYTNNTMFFHRGGLDNSMVQNSNVWTRSAFMYHSFVGSQTAFMRRNLLTLAKAGDYKGIAQMAGTVAVLFPQIAPLLAGAEKLLQTGSLQQGMDETKDRYRKLYSPNSVPEWAENYITLLSHIGAAGVYFNYISAIKGHRFAAALGGPFLGSISEDTEDAYTALQGNAKPLERDALRQLVPVVGQPLSHALLPTKIEEGGGPSSRIRSGRGFHRSRRR